MKFALYYFLVLLLFNCSCVQTRNRKTIFDEAGHIKSRGSENHFGKTGRWENFSPNGKLESRELWKNGVWVWRMTYNENHQRIKWEGANHKVKTYRNCDCSH